MRSIMRTLLICHEEEKLNSVVLPQWLASFSTLVGIVVLRETAQQKKRRMQRELKRVGWLRFLDVLAFRFYYTLFLSRGDRRWEDEAVRKLCRRYPALPDSTERLVSNSANSPQVREFIRSRKPDLVIARCKQLLKEEIFSIPRDGTFVMHPGICPEYRNAHGCFWALANDDRERVGMTLLRIDRGVDTGPVFGHFYCQCDERKESHIVIQHRTVFDNLDAIAKRLIEIHEGRAIPLDVSGRKSAAWGQPWLTRYIHWKREARSR
jgi:folate-dependent phosphoribosylglycinamide formyltransferase PurN